MQKIMYKIGAAVLLLIVLGAVISGIRESVKNSEAEKTKLNFIDQVKRENCFAAAKRVDENTEFKVIKTYSIYECYVKFNGYWMELSEYDIEKLLKQR